VACINGRVSAAATQPRDACLFSLVAAVIFCYVRWMRGLGFEFIALAKVALFALALEIVIRRFPAF